MSRRSRPLLSAGLLLAVALLAAETAAQEVGAAGWGTGTSAAPVLLRAERRPAPEASPAATIIREDFEGPLEVGDGGGWVVGIPAGGSQRWWWAKSACDHVSGSFSADAVRGGPSGGSTACGAVYPPNVETWLTWSEPFSIQGASSARLEFLLRGRTSTAKAPDGTALDYLGVYLSADRRIGYGYYWYGDLSAAWNAQSFDLTAWPGLGDLRAFPSLELWFYFRSGSGPGAGPGFRVDDVSLTTTSPGPAGPALLVPAVLASGGVGGAYYTTELALTNKGTQAVAVSLTYTPFLGGGAGTAVETLPAGTQKIVPDAVAWLRTLGVPIPATGNRGGTLRAVFAGADPGDVAVTARTTSVVPGGSAGLAYPAVRDADGLSSSAVVAGLQQTVADRSNLALLSLASPSQGDVVLRVALFSGDRVHPGSVVLPDVTLSPGGFVQLSQVLAAPGFPAAQGWARVTRISGSAPWFAYGVVNDQTNADGSFLPPLAEGALADRARATLPVIVETPTYTSELTIANTSSASKDVTLTYVADAIPNPGNASSVRLTLAPREQRILSPFVQWLRGQPNTRVPPAGPTFSGALYASVSSGDLSGVALGARTVSPGGGGRLGVFCAAVAQGSAASDAWLFDLRQDVQNRTNLAVVNTGEEDGSEDAVRVDVFRGDGGALAGSTTLHVGATHFVQIGSVLEQLAPSVSNAWARLTRTSGRNPFVAYAIVNDGGRPGERSGDGSFVPMSLGGSGGGGGSSTAALSVALAGSGSGTVTSSPAGIACGTTCSGAFAAGTIVTLSAVPGSGATFAGWGGACSGTGTCRVTLDADKAIAAGFAGESGESVLLESLPALAPVTFTTGSGETFTNDAYPGYLELIAQPGTSRSTVSAAVGARGGTIVAALPSAALYLARVAPGTEGAALSAFAATTWFSDGAPYSPWEIAQWLVQIEPLRANPAFTDPCGRDHWLHVAGVLGRSGATVRQADPAVWGPDVVRRVMDAAAAAGEHLVLNLSLQSRRSAQAAAAIRRNCQSLDCRAIRGAQLLYLHGLLQNLETAPAAVRNNTVLIVAAGNAGIDQDAELAWLAARFPSAWARARVVGGTDTFGSEDPWLNSGTIYARGRNVQVLDHQCTGTSFAAPEVARILREIWRQVPTLTSDQVVKALDQALAVEAVPAVPQDPLDGFATQGFINRVLANAQALAGGGGGGGGGGSLSYALQNPLPRGCVGVSYSNDLNRATGGAPPYHYQKQAGSQFPPFNLLIQPSGLLNGIPSITDTRTFTVEAIDTAGHSAAATTSLTIVASHWQGGFQTQAVESCPAQNGNWSADITQLGAGVIAGSWTDSFNGGPRSFSGSFDGTTARWTDPLGDITYTATFTGNGGVQGNSTGPICYTQQVHGTFQGNGACP